MKTLLMLIFMMATTLTAQHRFDVALAGKTTGDLFTMYGKPHNETVNEQTNGKRWLYSWQPITSDSMKVHSVEYGFIDGQVFFQKVSVKWLDQCSTTFIDSLGKAMIAKYGKPVKNKKGKSPSDMLMQWKVGKMTVIYFVSLSNDIGEPMLSLMFYDEKKIKSKP